MMILPIVYVLKMEKKSLNKDVSVLMGILKMNN